MCIKVTQLLMIYYQVLFGKFSSAVSVTAKDKCWADVAALVTAAFGINRSAAEIKKWSCMKSEAKTCASAARRSHTQTGGGPKSEEVDGQKQRIVSLIGEVSIFLIPHRAWK